jgi:hypothetical protein
MLSVAMVRDANVVEARATPTAARTADLLGFR